MTEGLADPFGQPDERLERLYRRWSRGGSGLLITGNVQVDRHHLERAGNVIIEGPPSDEMRSALRAWSDAAKSGGSKVWVQISHAGRQTPKAVNAAPLAPSAVDLNGPPGLSFGNPVAMDETAIANVIDRFVLASKVCEETGFDGVQIHAAHGYLLSQFLSPLVNRRQDQWGGSLENRARLLLTIVERVKAQAGKGFAISVKLNSADFQRGAFGEDDSVQVAQWLDERGIDLIEISGGTYEQTAMMGVSDKPQSAAQARTASREAYFLEFAPRIRAAVKKASLMITGGFRTRRVMNIAIEDDGVDIIGIARPVLADPESPQELLSGADELPRVECNLRIGPGWLSPNSPLKALKFANMGALQGWLYMQLERMGDGLPIDTQHRILRDFFAFKRVENAKLKAMRAAGMLK